MQSHPKPEMSYPAGPTRTTYILLVALSAKSRQRKHASALPSLLHVCQCLHAAVPQHGTRQLPRCPVRALGARLQPSYELPLLPLHGSRCRSVLRPLYTCGHRDQYGSFRRAGAGAERGGGGGSETALVRRHRCTQSQTRESACVHVHLALVKAPETRCTQAHSLLA